MSARLFEEIQADNDREKELARLTAQIKVLTTQLDKMYTDKLFGFLDDDDFQHIYLKIKENRSKLQERLKKLETTRTDEIIPSQAVDELIGRFWDSVDCNKELLVSLIERIEMTENKEIRIHSVSGNLETIDRLQ